MIRSASFHAAMARLALVAALLLAAVPTLGRLARQFAQPAHLASVPVPSTADEVRDIEVATRHADAHHAAGHRAHEQHAHGHRAAAHHGSGHPDVPPRAPHEHGGPDCAYCPLLLSLLAAAAWLLWLRADAARTVLPPWPASTRRAFVHPCGLGSRGPPGTSACLRA